MPAIEIDDQVFRELQALARPFVDQPNDVLRRLLELEGQKASHMPGRPPGNRNPAQFRTASGTVRKILAAQFPDSFTAVRPYRFMHEGPETLVYFQNFDKITDHLWYRLNRRPWHILATARKKAFLCLTCRAMGFAYLIPFADLNEALSAHPELRKRDSLEINIKVGSNFWTELEWQIGRYRIGV